ncbi:MAG: tetraacyldisaccharide 4'-kinase [Gammaproteobacteria bacterium]|nr:tetraacyldisaccharide 4'-kinase [Gammaproteobacteria bacterium]
MKLEKFFLKIWYQNYNGLGYLLYPFSLIYLAIISIRRWLYSIGMKKVTHFKVPIIVIGNITVGGTGKTPLVIWLAQHLQEKGLRVGIVSRGYKASRQNKPTWITPSTKVSIAGDEPLVMAHHLNCPIVVHSDRVWAVKTLLSKYHNCQVVMSDDGLQHYALGRDIEIVVMDEKRQVGNGFCLPAGPLREPASRLKTVDFVVYKVLDRLIAHAITIKLKPIHFVSVKDFKTIQKPKFFSGKKIHALSGIAHPEHFFATLNQIGIHPGSTQAFPDHYRFSFQDLDHKNADFIIMTEKDAVKCRRFADERHWFLKVKAEVSQGFGETIFKQLKELSAK